MPDRHCPKGAAAGSQFVLLPVCRYSSCMPGLCGGMLKAPAAERQRSGPLQPTVARERTTARAAATDGVEREGALRAVSARPVAPSAGSPQARRRPGR